MIALINLLLHRSWGLNLKSIQEYASIYVNDYELSVTPVKGKIPIVDRWQKVWGDGIFADRFEDAWLQSTGLGLLCGEASGLICLDIDILDSDEHLLPVLEELKSKMPPMLLGRVGNPSKPPAQFFRYNGDKSRKFKWIKIELLSDGNQVLMPPSLHPDTGDNYKWADKKLSEIDLDDLPELPGDLIQWLEEKNDEFKPKKKPNANGMGVDKSHLSPGHGRCNHQSHNHISSFAMAKYYAGISKDELVKAVMAYDNKINSEADYLYFNCPSRPWRSSDTLTNARSFINEIFNRHPEEHGKDLSKISNFSSDGENEKPSYFWENDKGEKKRSDKYDDYVHFFNWMYPTARKDFFSHVVFYKNKQRKDWYPVENDLRVIRSRARDCGLMPTLIEDRLYDWFNGLPPKLLVDLPDWDGTDHIGKVLSYITVKNVTHNQFESLFKAWMAGVFKRVFHPEFHNQCVILKGKQGLGKDMLLGNIFRALNGYYSEIILSARQKDNYESIESLMVSYIPEFDESNKSSMASLKAFISTNKATFRGAYDRKATAHIFRHSVVSSANIDNILRDPTGNRRFWIFELDDINWKYNDIIDSGQVMAQAVALYKEGYVASANSLEAMREYIEECTPQHTEDLFIEEAHHFLEGRIEELSKRFGLPGANHHDGRIRWHMISDEIVKIARKYNLAPRTAQTILKKKGYSKSDKKSSYYVVPINNVMH